MKVKELIHPSEFDQKGTEMTLHNFYKVKDFGSRTKIRPETVVIRDSKTGKIYGRKTIWQKVT